ncbi:o-succinylbenzoate synthase [Shewanella salipaludis]|uniref:o-succinylbenzoate synthase n=1 Tax=Shewanella salipaludis TaxID=2723052 RepID=A0A972FXH2_9GAMM|nr:o-succinylbenzoate synthase [Shewanella salipaludis]NMH65053.1 o-succinylbenzoate synthase [Shewanella salipaludis]
MLSSLRLYHYRIPLTPPLAVARQRIAERRGLVLQASSRTAAGAVRRAWVEIAPLSGADTQGRPLTGFSPESLHEVTQYLRLLLPTLLQQPLASLRRAAQGCELASAAYGLSLLHARLSGACDHRPARTQPTAAVPIPLIYLNPGEDPRQAAARIRALPAGITRVKLKVAQTHAATELKLLHEVLAIRPEFKLRLDANQGWDLEQAIAFGACLPKSAIEYIEEPCRTLAENIAFHRALGLGYALDESLHQAGFSLAPHPGLVALCIKPMLFGELGLLREFIGRANAMGLRCILGSSLETSLGIAAIAALASRLTPDEAPGIDTLGAFAQDLLVSSGKAECLGQEQLTLLAEAGPW